MPDNPTLGQIIMFAGGWTPYGYMPCDGRTLSIGQYATLYSLLGTNYGGDGRSTFNLPDLRNRVPLGYGTEAVTGQYYPLGYASGADSVTMQTIPVSAVEDPDSGQAAVAASGTISTVPPYTTVAYYIAYKGIYPSQW